MQHPPGVGRPDARLVGPAVKFGDGVAEGWALAFEQVGIGQKGLAEQRRLVTRGEHLVVAGGNGGERC